MSSSHFFSVEIRHKREEVKETLTEDDLGKVVNLTLTETETIWLLDMPGTSVSNESEEAPKVKKRNEEYQEVREHPPDFLLSE